LVFMLKLSNQSITTTGDAAMDHRSSLIPQNGFSND
jgi:hypothetical protein